MEAPNVYQAEERPGSVVDKAVAAEARKFLSTALAEYRRLGVILGRGRYRLRS